MTEPNDVVERLREEAEWYSVPSTYEHADEQHETRDLLLEAAAALTAARAALSVAEQDLKVHKEFTDLWYFVMDEKPLEFERIVATYPPARWMDVAHKLRRGE